MEELVITPRILNHLTFLFLTKASDRSAIETMRRVKLENWSSFNHIQSVLHVKGFQYRRHKSDNFINALMEFDQPERIQLFLSMFFHSTAFVYQHSCTEHRENISYKWGEILGSSDPPRWEEPFRGTEEESLPVVALCLSPLFARTYVLFADDGGEEKNMMLLTSPRGDPRIQLGIYRWCMSVSTLVLRDMPIEIIVNRLKQYSPALETQFWNGYRDARMTV